MNDIWSMMRRKKSFVATTTFTVAFGAPTYAPLATKWHNFDPKLAGRAQQLRPGDLLNVFFMLVRESRKWFSAWDTDVRLADTLVVPPHVEKIQPLSRRTDCGDDDSLRHSCRDGGGTIILVGHA